MNAFAQASAILHANRDGSVELIYQPQGAPTVRGIRGIRERPVENFDLSPRGGGATTKGERLSLAYASLPQPPQRGDQVQIMLPLLRDEDILTVDAVEPDDESHRWLLTFTRATLPR